VNIKKTRLSQSDYFSLFAVEESVVEDQVQLFLFQPSDLWDRGISATDFRLTVFCKQIVEMRIGWVS